MSFSTLNYIARYLSLALLISCTQRKEMPKVQGLEIRSYPPQTITAVANIKLDGRDTRVDQMLVKDNNLYLTGTSGNGGGEPGMGISKWEIGSNPEEPYLVFNTGDQQDTAFLANQPWGVEYYARSALALLGNDIITSGTAGASFFTQANVSHPVEKGRFPQALNVINGESIPRDERYVAKAIAVHPSLPIAYFFREQDFVFTMTASGNNLTVAAQDAYAANNANVCCVSSATVFMNRVFVAFRSRIWGFDLQANGRLGAAQDMPLLQAVNVASTNQYLYVQHQPIVGSSDGGSRSAGIYVFDQQGNSLAFLNVSPSSFAVSSDDSHLFVNETGKSVTVYRINWTATGM